MKTLVLLIDDDLKLAELLRGYFERFELELISAPHPDEGLKLLRQKQPAAVILDVMLPGRDGFAVCREIRGQSDVPILMLSARGETTDRIVGLEFGADDYLPKPFEPRELVARIQTILRRSAGRGGDRRVMKFGELEIRVEEREAYLRGEALKLTSAEYDLLHLFATHPAKKMDRDEIMNRLQGIDSNVYSRSIDILVSRLRAKLGDDPKDPHFIKTARGAGYVFLSGGTS